MMRLPAWLSALLSASFRGKQKRLNKMKKRMVFATRFFFVKSRTTFKEFKSQLVIHNPALPACFSDKRFQCLVLGIFLVGFESFSIEKFTVQHHIS